MSPGSPVVMRKKQHIFKAMIMDDFETHRKKIIRIDQKSRHHTSFIWWWLVLEQRQSQNVFHGQKMIKSVKLRRKRKQNQNEIKLKQNVHSKK